jgi:hypothetical protein
VDTEAEWQAGKLDVPRSFVVRKGKVRVLVTGGPFVDVIVMRVRMFVCVVVCVNLHLYVCTQVRMCVLDGPGLLPAGSSEVRRGRSASGPSPHGHVCSRAPPPSPPPPPTSHPFGAAGGRIHHTACEGHAQGDGTQHGSKASRAAGQLPEGLHQPGGVPQGVPPAHVHPDGAGREHEDGAPAPRAHPQFSGSMACLLGMQGCPLGGRRCVALPPAPSPPPPPAHPKSLA